MTIKQQIASKVAQWSRLGNVSDDPRVQKITDDVLAERKPRRDAIMAEIKALQAQEKPRRVKVRIPLDCPPAVVDACKAFWHGTTEYESFSIKAWNARAAVTVGGSTGYSDNAGWHPCPPSYYVIDLTTTRRHLGESRPRILLNIETSKQQRATPTLFKQWIERDYPKPEEP